MHALPKPPSEGSSRMEPLAKLPVFWTLEKKRVVIVGGSDAAAWKAELMLACGAQVEVFTEEAGDGLQILLTSPLRHPSASLVHHRRRWAPPDLVNAELAIADFDEDAEARCFFDAARSLGVPVNVIDKPAYCQFQFGSIVNRSPVVVAISTDGAAPILAQAIRRKIETLLPRAIQSWAQIARSLRDHVNRQLKTTSERRIFWERFADDAFRDVPSHDAEKQLLESARGIKAAAAKGGCVTLVGAGPGDAELLTLKAVRALQAADIILFDDLVSADVLELARREAKRMLVGKRGGRTSCRQEDINEMMVKFARAGKRVVRLKSGDPMIFGRAGEEIACLERQNIPVDVIPGITAASAMAAGLGLSLTHRDHAQSVRYITGHSRSGVLPDDMDWRSIADPKTTNVFYMGGRTACLIAERLVEAGASPSTPAVIVSNVSRPAERQWHGTLARLGEGINEIGYDHPVLIAVGRALAERQTARDAIDVQGNSTSMMVGA
ncbi:uroporphyrinogen-III C-methyltransferase [Neorhizobium sp. P12A]|uniref:siroheme synthase CysG n=1 Tax=Neorhizobium sp. P12A TaxID=2268027 RepID=UPI0011EBE71B|nr:siroheme synthase CysG [Neorhizobium sp. P12A]KAA0697946.1 uroporphyrinogen-III C-methyltransferase [Neorhizobium sp. P12A]